MNEAREPLAFISYRRQDSSAAARSLSEMIQRKFGPASVFMDTESIRMADDWPARIDRALQSATVVIAVIGPGWLRIADNYGRRRIDKEDDWVRNEIRHGLENSIAVLPILLSETPLPERSALPDCLGNLASRQAFALRDDRWEHDLNLLLSRLEELGFQKKTNRMGPDVASPPTPGDDSDGTTALKGLDEYLSSFIKEYNALPDIRKDPLLRIYIPVRFELRQGFSALPTRFTDSEDLTALVHAWLDDDGCLLFLLGDYGSGKTSFLRHLMYKQAEAFRDNKTDRIPLLVRLREHTDNFEYPHFLSQHLQTQCGFKVPFKSVEKLMEEGRFLIMLDGFDELATNATVESRQANFQEIGKLFRKRNKILLTSRPTYFLTDDEIRALFMPLPSIFANYDSESASDNRKKGIAKRAERIKPLHERLRAIDPDTHTLSNFGQPLSATIAPFSNDDIVAYVTAAVDQSGDWTPEELLARIKDTFDLQDLARRPILLKMIVATLPQLPRNKPISVSELYEAYTIQWLERDYSAERLHHLIDKESSYRFMTSLAKQMSDEAVERVSYTQLAQTIRNEFGIRNDTEAEALATDIRTCSFLLRDEVGYLEFAHKSFREYFLSLYLLPNIMKNEWAVLRQVLSWEVLLFLGHHLQFENEAHYVRQQFNNLTNRTLSKTDSVFVQNCLTLYSSMGLPINGRTFLSLHATAFRLWRTSSDKMQFKNSQLAQCRFEKNNATNLSIQQSTLSDCLILDGHFRGARWDASTFRGGEICRNSVEGEYIATVKLIQVNLARTHFRSVVFDRVRFIGVNVTDTQFRECVFFACEFRECIGVPQIDDCRFHSCRRDESAAHFKGTSFACARDFADRVRSLLESAVEILKSVDDRVDKWRSNVASRTVQAQRLAEAIRDNWKGEIESREQILRDLNRTGERITELDNEASTRREKIRPDVVRKEELKKRNEAISDALDGNRKQRKDIENKLNELEKDARADLKRKENAEKSRREIESEIERKTKMKDVNKLGRTSENLSHTDGSEGQQEENVDRGEEIDDVLSKKEKELLSVVADIERIAKKLEPYEKKRKELETEKRKLEKVLTSDELWRTKDKKQAVENELQEVTRRTAKDEARIEEIAKKLAELRDNRKSLEGRIPKLDASIDKLAGEYDNHKILVDKLKKVGELSKFKFRRFLESSLV